MRRSLKHRSRRGTEGSNLVPSSGESYKLSPPSSCAAGRHIPDGVIAHPSEPQFSSSQAVISECR